MTRRSFLLLFSAHYFLPHLGALPASAPRRLLGVTATEFRTVSTTIVLPGLSHRLVLSPGDKCGLGWYEDQGDRRAVLLIQRSGESMIHFVR